MLRAQGVGVAHGAVTVLSGVDLTVAAGDRIAVVGPNGVGKTTLLRVLAGELTPETGTVTRHPAGATVVHVPQEPGVRAGETVADNLARRTGVAAAQARLDATTAALAAGERGADDAYAAALETWLALGGADLPRRAEAVAARLSLPPLAAGPTGAGPGAGPGGAGPAGAGAGGAGPGDAGDGAGRGADTLSGGQSARLRLAAVLLTRADVLLLDEPTNDLDDAGLAALEALVAGYPGGIVLVSHDREFLARTATAVLELDEFTRTATAYGGGWEAYLAERAAARARAEQDHAEYAATRDALTERARTLKEWARAGARRAADPRNEPDKNIRFREVQRSQRTGAKGAATERELARLEPVEQPRDPWQLRLTLATAGRGSELVFSLRDAVVERGDVRLGPVSLTVHAGDRLRITGPNGAGKTTLLDALLGRAPLRSGSRYAGPGVVVGELDQTRRDLRGPAPLLEVFRELSGLDAEEARTLLAKFRVGADVVLRPADTLSPGERTRVGLALFQARGSTCIVLDEPTNHLDLPAIEQLETALDSYDGTLLVVTHDRRLAAAVRFTGELDVRTLTAAPASP